MPALRHCSVGPPRRTIHGPARLSGIHAGMPTTQCLRSASVVNGAPRSTSTPRRPDSRPGSSGRTLIHLWVFTSITVTQHPLWELSLLAMAVGQLMKMLAVPPSSRASSLPQFFRGVHKHHSHPASLVGAELARDGDGSVDEGVGCAAIIASKLAPTVFSGCSQASQSPSIPCGS
ncbi:hypothetical protein PHLH4_57420 [Pseudomonas sp. St316]|nr:hypothetical protein PHLH4_57420 [Pseudomonas sp. St316]